MKRDRRTITFAVLLLLVFASVVAALSIGSVDIPFLAVMKILLSEIPGLSHLTNDLEPWWSTVVLTVRLPVVVMALFAGAALATSGASLQGLFRNPLVDPFIIGISAGGSIGWVIGVIITIDSTGTWVDWFRALLSFVGAMAAVLTAYMISRTGSKIPVTNLLLAGVAISASLTAGTQFLVYTFIENPRQVLITLLGTCSHSTWSEILVVAPVVAISIPILIIKGKDINAFSMGEEDARGLGVNVERTKFLILGVASLLAAVTVPFCGMIGFVGLMIPHMMRRIVGPDHRFLIPASALFGASFLVISDLISRSILDQIVPLGIVTGLIGGTFFLYLMRARRGSF